MWGCMAESDAGKLTFIKTIMDHGLCINILKNDLKQC